MQYFTLYDPQACILDATSAWYAQHGHRVCPGCGALDREAGLPDLEVTWIDAKWTAGAARLGIPVMHRRVAEIIGWDVVAADLWTSRVYTTESSQGDDWVAYWGKEYVFERYTVRVSYRDCPLCLRRFYIGAGRHHTLLEPPFRDLYEAHVHELMVSERIRERLLSVTTRPKPRLRYRKVEVLPEPLDGLGRF